LLSLSALIIEAERYLDALDAYRIAQLDRAYPPGGAET
jgi:hypothetical protein